MCVRGRVIAGTNTPDSGLRVQAGGTSIQSKARSHVDQSVALPYIYWVSGLTVS